MALERIWLVSLLLPASQAAAVQQYQVCLSAHGFPQAPAFPPHISLGFSTKQPAPALLYGIREIPWVAATFGTPKFIDKRVVAQPLTDEPVVFLESVLQLANAHNASFDTGLLDTTGRLIISLPSPVPSTAPIEPELALPSTSYPDGLLFSGTFRSPLLGIFLIDRQPAGFYWKLIETHRIRRKR